MYLITEFFQTDIVAMFSYEDMKDYQEKHLLVAIGTIVLIFFILGWLISKMFRPSSRLIKNELEAISGELIEDLNASKKFNARHQEFAAIDESDDRQKPSNKDAEGKPTADPLKK